MHTRAAEAVLQHLVSANGGTTIRPVATSPYVCRSARVAAKCAGADSSPEHPSRFMEKMFSEREIARSIRNVRSPYQHLAACFAAREAFFKATQVWYMRSNVSIAQRPSGEPFYVLSERILGSLEEMYGAARASRLNICVSLTHDDTYATAFAVCEWPEQAGPQAR